MLQYNGRGFLPGIPARDLQEAEIDALFQTHGITRKFLTDSGCYADTLATQTTTKNTKTVKIVRGKDETPALDKEKG